MRKRQSPPPRRRVRRPRMVVDNGLLLEITRLQNGANVHDIREAASLYGMNVYLVNDRKTKNWQEIKVKAEEAEREVRRLLATYYAAQRTTVVAMAAGAGR